MKAIGLPPSDPRVRQMNDAQWLWCYFNQLEDEKEEAEKWKDRFDYLTWFINPEMAKSVHEEQARNSSDSKYKQEGVHKNADFELEMKAALLGYNPASGLTVEEFLAQYENKNKQQNETEEKENQTENKEIDIMSDSFEDLIANGGFVEVVDATQGVGNPYESLDDFLDRVFAFEEQLMKEEAKKHFGEDEMPIGIEEEDLQEIQNQEENHGISPNNTYNVNINDTSNTQDYIDPDLDFIEVDFSDED